MPRALADPEGDGFDVGDVSFLGPSGEGSDAQPQPQPEPEGFQAGQPPADAALAHGEGGDASEATGIGDLPSGGEDQLLVAEAHPPGLPQQGDATSGDQLGAQDQPDQARQDGQAGDPGGCAGGGGCPNGPAPPQGQGGSLAGAGAGAGAGAVAGALTGGPPGRDDRSPDDDWEEPDSELNRQIDAVYVRVADLKLDVEEALEAYRAAHPDEPGAEPAPPSMSPTRRQELIAELGRISADLERLAPAVGEGSPEEISLRGVRREIRALSEAVQPTQTLEQRIDRFKQSLDFFEERIRNIRDTEGPSRARAAGTFHDLLAGELEGMSREVAPWLPEGLTQRERLAALTDRANGVLGQLDELRRQAGEQPATEESVRAEQERPPGNLQDAIEESLEEIEQAGGHEEYILRDLQQAYEEDVQAGDREGLRDTLQTIEFFEEEFQRWGVEPWSEEYRRLQALKEQTQKTLEDLGNAMSMPDDATREFVSGNGTLGHTPPRIDTSIPPTPAIPPRDRNLVTGTLRHTPPRIDTSIPPTPAIPPREASARTWAEVVTDWAPTGLALGLTALLAVVCRGACSLSTLGPALRRLDPALRRLDPALRGVPVTPVPGHLQG
jgi:hypothetical protein